MLAVWVFCLFLSTTSVPEKTSGMLEPRKLNYVILPSAEIVEFNNKTNIQRLTGDVNSLRDHNMRKCQVIICHMFKISSETREEVGKSILILFFVLLL